MTEPPPRCVVVSFHDLHPGTRADCARFVERARALGIERLSLLVVPCWHGAAPVSADRDFARWLRGMADAGHEICLHGFEHRAHTVRGGPWQWLIGRHYTDGEGEFHQIDRADAARRVRAGLAMLGGQLGLRVDGFTPPAWLLSEPGRRALVDAGLAYSTSWSGIELLQGGGFEPAPTLAWSSRSALRRLLSRGWVRAWARWQRDAPILRIAVHPRDLAHPAIVASIDRSLHQALAAGRVPLTYRELVPGLRAESAADAA